MRTNVITLFAVLSLVVTTVAATLLEECDMKDTIKAFHCTDCDGVFEKKQLVSDKTIYVCEECEVIAEKPGTCEWCEQPLEKKVSGKDVCPDCLVGTEECEACRKVYFECPECGATSLEPGKCTECAEEDGPVLEERVSLALITYVCDGCYSPTIRPGRCVDEKCKCHGQPRHQTCSASGTFPHGPKK